MKALPSINLKNSSIFSLKLSAFELNTKSLLVKYANNTAKIIAIALDIFSSNLKHDVIIHKLCICYIKIFVKCKYIFRNILKIFLINY